MVHTPVEQIYCPVAKLNNKCMAFRRLYNRCSLHKLHDTIDSIDLYEPRRLTHRSRVCVFLFLCLLLWINQLKNTHIQYHDTY